jgi:hypothetical protein
MDAIASRPRGFSDFRRRLMGAVKSGKTCAIFHFWLSASLRQVDVD